MSIAAMTPPLPSLHRAARRFAPMPPTSQPANSFYHHRHMLLFITLIAASVGRKAGTSPLRRRRTRFARQNARSTTSSIMPAVDLERFHFGGLLAPRFRPVHRRRFHRAILDADMRHFRHFSAPMPKRRCAEAHAALPRADISAAGDCADVGPSLFRWRFGADCGRRLFISRSMVSQMARRRRAHFCPS